MMLDYHFIVEEVVEAVVFTEVYLIIHELFFPNGGKGVGLNCGTLGRGNCGCG